MEIKECILNRKKGIRRMEQQQQHQSPHYVCHDHEHRGQKGHRRHLKVRGLKGRRYGSGHHVHVHGHKHGGRHGHGHGQRHRHGYNGHVFMLGIEQIELWGHLIVARACGSEQPQPAESFAGEIIPHYHRYRNHQNCGQVTEAGTPYEMSGAIVRMSLEDEPDE